MLDPATGPYRFTSGHSVDIAAAVAVSPPAFEIQVRPGQHGKTLRNAVTVIVMAAQARAPEAKG